MRFIAGLLVAVALTFGFAPVASANEGRLAPEVRQVQTQEHEVRHLRVTDVERNGKFLYWELNDGSAYIGTRECRTNHWLATTRCRKAWWLVSWGR